MLEPDFRILSLAEIGCHDELPETRDTLEGNSLQKAEFVYRRFGLPCVADDTGLEVEALNGEPGVYSARYAGDQRSTDDNIALLLARLAAHPNRKARFRTIITLIGSAGIHTFEGVVNGVILAETRGSSGFGYDPVFLPAGHQRTLAEMTLDEKNQISHRGHAIKKLVDYLQSQKGARL